MSLLGSVSCFVNGTSAELSVLRQVIEGRFGPTNSTLLIGIALLIFGYGIYELVISDIDPRQQEPSTVRRNLLKSTAAAQPGSDLPPLAQMVPALGGSERSMGKQLLLIRHGLKQRGPIGMHPRGAPAESRKAFPLQRHNSQTRQKTKGLHQR